MITLKTDSELRIMDRCNQIVLSVLAELGGMMRPGMELGDLDAHAEERACSEGALPAFKGYRDFPRSLCVSVNDQVVHGIPGKQKLREGDIVSLDFGVIVEGLYGDSAHTFAVGEITPDRQELMDVTLESLRLGIEQVRTGKRTGDIGYAVQEHAEAHGFSVVKEFVGHGIGRELHEEPQVPNYGRPGRGTRLETGMVLAIEPMVNQGAAPVKVESDQWTVRTRDGRPSAHFERSVAVTAAGPWILGRGLPPGEICMDLPEPLTVGASQEGTA